MSLLQKYPALVITAVLLASYPLLLLPGKFPGDLPLVDFNVLTPLALGLLALRTTAFARLWQSGKLMQLWFVTLGFCVILSLYFYRANRESMDQLVGGLGLLVLPLLGMVYRREGQKYLPQVLAALFVVNLVHLAVFGAFSPYPYGLTGNWNWSWTLLAACAPAAALMLPPGWRLGGAVTLTVVVLLLPAVIFPQYLSKGTLIAAALAAIFLLLRRFLSWPRFLILAAAAAVILICVIPYFKLESDIRRDLWQGSLATISLTGHGPGSFENVVAGHLPTRYFLSPFAADRHLHPHNQILLYVNDYGLGGLLFFAGLLLLALRNSFRLSTDPVLLWPFLLFAIHGMVDTVLSTVLIGCLFALLSGMLASNGKFRHHPNWLLANLAFVLAGLLLLSNIVSNYCYREAKLALLNGQTDAAAKCILWSINTRPNNDNLYLAGTISLFNLKDPVKAERYFTAMNQDNYSHRNGRLARALAAQGKFTESIPYFEAEERNFPLSLINLYYFNQVRSKLNLPVDKQRFEDILRLKNIPEKEIPCVLKNNVLDDNLVELKSHVNQHQ